jgi:signal transduction histidine kinase
LPVIAASLRAPLAQGLRVLRSWHGLPGILRGLRVLGNIPVSPRARLRFFVHFLHELRTPIALVDGPLQQLARQPGLDAAARDLVAVARQNCLRLQRISEDFLELSRVERRRDAPRAPVDLDDWLRGLCAAAMHHPGLGRADLREEFGADGAYVLAERNALDRIFLNLLSNAVKFSSGRGEIRIGSRADAARAGFFVEDHGIGIHPRRHRAIFRRFRQAEPSIARQFGGFGLGLALVRELARQHGASVEVQSRPGAGARFTVWFPRTTAPAVPGRIPLRSAPAPGGEVDLMEVHLRRPLPAPPPVPPQDAATTAAAGPAPATARTDGRPRVVVVEDEPEMRWLIGTALGSEFDFEFAADAESGWAATLLAPPDVVLTDWRLPGADGLALAARVRALPDPPRVALVSAHLQEPERVAALRHGVDDFLPKPFSIAELGARLRNLAQARRAEQLLREVNARLGQANCELAATRAALVQEEKLKSIGLLAAGLIHEIQNPVNYMQTAVALLREPAGAAQCGDLMQTCEEGLRRVATIINDLRVFSHRRDAAAGPRPLIQLDDAARCALRLCRGTLEDVDVLARLEPCRVPGDEGQIVQVFVNLLVNAAAAARGASHAGTPAATPVPSAAPPPVEIEVLARSGHALARVADRGPGFSPRILARLFEPFCTTREAGQGMGLGLAISRAIVLGHGGSMQAANRPGGGATVEFTLPVREAARHPPFEESP